MIVRTNHVLLGMALLAMSPFCAAVLLACGPQGGTDTGNPPIIDESGIMVAELADHAFVITAAPGTINPPGAQLQITDLLLDGPPRIIDVAGDGGFMLETDPAVLRLQAVLGAERSDDVVDVRTALDGIQSLGDCRPMIEERFIRMSGGAGEESVQRFRATAVCGEPLAVSLRRGGQGLTVSGSVIDDAVLEVTVRFDGRARAEDEVQLVGGGEIVWVSILAEAR